CWPRRAGGSSITPGSARSSTSSFTAPTGWTQRRAQVFSGWPGTSWDPGSAAGTSSTSASISPRQAAIELTRTPPTLIAPGPTRSSTAFWPEAARPPIREVSPQGRSSPQDAEQAHVKREVVALVEPAFRACLRGSLGERLGDTAPAQKPHEGRPEERGGGEEQ